MTIANARQVCFDAAKRAGVLAAHGVMILSELGEVDAAFDVAGGFLLWRGPFVRGSRSTSKLVRKDASWRLTFMAGSPFFAMPRTHSLCHCGGMDKGLLEPRGVRRF